MSILSLACHHPTSVIGKAFDEAHELLACWGKSGGNEDIWDMLRNGGWPLADLADRIAVKLLSARGYDDGIIDALGDDDPLKLTSEGVDAELARTINACEACEGGEISHGSCAIPDCEHMDTCGTCGGTGVKPTAMQIAELRHRCLELEGDRMVTDAEIAAAREQLGAHPFDVADWRGQRPRLIAALRAVLKSAHPHPSMSAAWGEAEMLLIEIGE